MRNQIYGVFLGSEGMPVAQLPYGFPAFPTSDGVCHMALDTRRRLARRSVVIDFLGVARVQCSGVSWQRMG